MKFSLFVFVLFLCQWTHAGDDLRIYPVDATAQKSTVFSVTVNGQPVFTQKFKDIHYVHFAHNKKVKLVITTPVLEDGYQLSPGSGVIVHQKTSNALTLELAKPGYHVLTLPNQERLFILTDSVGKEEGKTTKWINVMQYGIDASGEKVTTAGLQKAINEAASKKKILYFPKGIYRTGTLHFPSNAQVYIASGALIKGSENRDDYPVDAGRQEADHVHDKEHYTDNGEWMTFSRLLLIDSAVNVKIWGAGTIDGSGSIVRAQGKPANLIRIRNSKNVWIEGLVLRDPAAWNTHILRSENITMRNIKMINDRSVPNTDGFDPDASINVLIDHCFAYCSDDNVAIKTTNNGGLLDDCEKITVRRCVFLTKKSALKLGTETRGRLMHNISFENNYVIEADRGLVLYCYDGAVFQNISFVGNYFEQGFADNQKKAIHFQIKNRSGAGQIKNVLIRDCSFSEKFHAASELTGLDAAHKIEGVRFKNVVIAGKPIMSLNDMQVKTNSYVQDISFEK